MLTKVLTRTAVPVQCFGDNNSVPVVEELCVSNAVLLVK
jgi:hypothetical protein